MANNNYRLCYIRDNVLYFTDNFEHQWGDDWNDTSYEHNAGFPYEWNDIGTKKWNDEHGRGHIRYFAYLPEWCIRQPCDGHINSPYSVEDINKGAVAWLYHEDAGGLMGGATIDEAIAWFRRAKVKWGALKE